MAFLKTSLDVSATPLVTGPAVPRYPGLAEEPDLLSAMSCQTRLL